MTGAPRACPCSTQGGERGFHVLTFALPLNETLFVFFQNIGRNLLREVRIGQLLLDLGNLGLDFFQLFGQPRLLRFHVNQTFERQKQFAQFAFAPSACFCRLIICVHFHRLGVEQQPDNFDVVRRQFAAGLRMNLTFLFAGNVRRRAAGCGLAKPVRIRASTCFSVSARSGRNGP